MTYQGIPATPPRLWAVWNAVLGRLRAAPQPSGYVAASQVYRDGQSAYSGSESEMWWRLALVPITTAYPGGEQPGRAIRARFMVRAEVHVPSEAMDTLGKLEALQIHAFERLHGWLPPGPFTYATVRLPIRRDVAPEPIPLRDDERDLWFTSSEYLIVVETPDL